MPPKKSFLSDDSSDDDLLPDNSKNAPKPTAKPATASPLQDNSSFASIATRPSQHDDPPIGMPPAAPTSTTQSDATLEMLRARREMRSRVAAPSAISAPPPAASAPVMRESPLRSETAAANRNTSHAASVGGRTSPAPEAARAATPTGSRQPSVQPTAAAVTATEAPQPPKPDAAALAAAAAEAERAEVARLLQLISEREVALAQAKERESALQRQDEADAKRHDENSRHFEEELRRLEREQAYNDDEFAQERARIRSETEELVNLQLKSIDEAVDAEYAPKINELQQRLNEMNQEREQLQHAMSLTSANKSIVDQAILAATQRIASKLESEFAKRFDTDDVWEGQLADMVRKALNDSFLPQLKADEEAERAEHQRAFQEMLNFWRQAEDEERDIVVKNDDILLAELQSMAHADLDVLHREELELQQAFIRARDDWAARHKQALDREIDASMEHRDAEFAEIRKAQSQLYAQRLAEINRSHELEVQRLQAAHEQELKSLREAQGMRQALEDERKAMYAAVQRDADDAAIAMRETAAGLTETVSRLDAYKLALDKRTEELEREYEADLNAREAAVAEVQELVIQQATTMDAERRAISSALTKLDAINQQLTRQSDDTKSWVAQAVAKLDKSKQEWEREYRRWQHVAAQEKRSAEQRYSGLLLELRRGCEALREEREALDVELEQQRRRSDDRGSRMAQQAAMVRQREEEIRAKHHEMIQLIAELEAKSKAMSDEWHRLHLERQDLHYRRAELQAEEATVRATEEQIRNMRHALVAVQGDAIAASERAKAAQDQASMLHQFTEAERSRIQRDQQENATREARAKVAMQVQQRHAAAARASEQHAAAAAASRHAQQRPGAATGLVARVAEPTLAERLLMEMRSDARQLGLHVGGRHADPVAVGQRSANHATHSHHQHQGGHGATATAATAAAPGAAAMTGVSNVEVSRTTHGGALEGTVATSHWTALERLSELETTSGSTGRRS